MNQQQQTEYGLVYYDVPSDEFPLYVKLKKIINRMCLPVNLSVYIFNWGFKHELEAELKSINIFSKANIHLVKFDSAATTELERVAAEQLQQVFDKMLEKVKKSMKELPQTHQKKSALERYAFQLKNYYNLITIYSFTNRLLPALDTLKKYISIEYNKVA